MISRNDLPLNDYDTAAAAATTFRATAANPPQSSNRQQYPQLPLQPPYQRRHSVAAEEVNPLRCVSFDVSPSQFQAQYQHENFERNYLRSHSLGSANNLQQRLLNNNHNDNDDDEGDHHHHLHQRLQESNNTRSSSNDDQEDSLAADNIHNHHNHHNEQFGQQQDVDFETYEMSSLFRTIFKENRVYLVMTMVCDAILGIISLVIYTNRCSIDEVSDLEFWNKQWSYYFFGKVLYHFLIFLQFFSHSLKEAACDYIGEYRTPFENLERQTEYDNFSERQRQQVRMMLDKELLEFYYKRNVVLKGVYLLKSLITLSYVIYGIVIFFEGDYFTIWMNSSMQTQSCQYYLTLWVYLSIIIVIASNRQIFDIIITIVIILPLVLFIYLPYQGYKRIQKMRQRNKALRKFPSIKYSAGKVKGDTECAICRMDYENGEKIIVLPCNEIHHFHFECITSWLKVNMTCPLCRFNFAEEPEVPAENDNQQLNNNNGQYIPPQFQEQEQDQNQINYAQHMQIESVYDSEEENSQHQNQHEQDQEDELSLMKQLCSIFTSEEQLHEFLDGSEYSQEIKIKIVIVYRALQHQQPPQQELIS